MNITHDNALLRKAFEAWNGCGTLRRSRQRNKRFTFGDQWSDSTLTPDGQRITDWERFTRAGTTPVTNNLIRQLVKTVVGRFRAQVIDAEKPTNEQLQQVRRDNLLDELDARALEEFLISGCCVQRIERAEAVGDPNAHIEVSNVNPNVFFVNAFLDPRGRDCRLLGQLHDLPLSALLHRVAGGQRRKAAWVRRLYSEQTDARVAECATQLGADSPGANGFWQSAVADTVRAIEVWSLESREVMVCHNRRTAQVQVASLAEARKLRGNPEVAMRWDVDTQWHCRWFAPTGDLLAHWQATSHPFVMRFHPLIDGEVHALVEDVIDQQKYLNRLISLVDQTLMASAKGVLLYPDTALPEGFTWADVRRVWSNPGGILPYSPALGNARPEQIQSNGSNFGAYDMIELQMKLLEEVSGVHGALQGKNVATGGSATLYQLQSQNADLALTDLYDTFNAFRQQRDQVVTSVMREAD
ncbi:MAG: hypothetical protein IKR25_00545 [Muribaculaceae bacterium]|nr:hypothetical protein [Muribaculaceae bacterium]